MVRYVDMSMTGGAKDPSDGLDSLCCIKIISPQKSFIVGFKNEIQKNEWLEILVRLTKEVREKRRLFLECN